MGSTKGIALSPSFSSLANERVLRLRIPKKLTVAHSTVKVYPTLLRRHDGRYHQLSVRHCTPPRRSEDDSFQPCHPCQGIVAVNLMSSGPIHISEMRMQLWACWAVPGMSLAESALCRYLLTNVMLVHEHHYE